MKKTIYILALLFIMAGCAKRDPNQMVDNIVKAKSATELTCAERKLAGKIADVLPRSVAVDEGRFVMVMEQQAFEESGLPTKVYEMISGEVSSLNMLLGNGMLNIADVGDLMDKSAAEFRALSSKR